MTSGRVREETANPGPTFPQDEKFLRAFPEGTSLPLLRKDPSLWEELMSGSEHSTVLLLRLCALPVRDAASPRAATLSLSENPASKRLNYGKRPLVSQHGRPRFRFLFTHPGPFNGCRASFLSQRMRAVESLLNTGA